MATFASFRVPTINNEPNKHYAKGSAERESLAAAIKAFKQNAPLQVPVVVGGAQTKGSSTQTQPQPADHAKAAAQYGTADSKTIDQAIEAALSAKMSWETLPFADRAAIFLKAADLISGKYRYEIMAATMVGQGKNAWQAEIESAAELCDFLRFNVRYAEELYAQQPVHNSPGVWNRVEYRALEGFVYAISPFNFTAIGGNLPCAPALMGNVVLWKPSPSAMASNWLLYNILLEAGLPANVIQFVPGDAEEITKAALAHRQFAALHYTGSTGVFRSLYGQIAAGTAEGRYAGYPRVVGETGGKNFHVIHRSASVRNAVIQTVRAAFEYQGQKCSACSRAYVPASLWDAFRAGMTEETQKLKQGDPEEFGNFVGPVIHGASFAKLKKVIDDAQSDPELTLLAGGTYDDSRGYYIRPTVYQTSNPDHELMRRELFGPVVVLYAYDDATPSTAQAWADVCAKVDATSEYGLTGAVFAADKAAVRYAEEALRHAAGNFYINCKSTGAIVGQQPFGGARASGTNDKAGSIANLLRFVNMRAIKEQFVEDPEVEYPSNKV